MAQRHDCLTAAEYWEQRGESPAEAMRRAPTPWWMLQNQPQPPRQLRRGAIDPKPPEAQQRPEGNTRRRLVRVGARGARATVEEKG